MPSQVEEPIPQSIPSLATERDIEMYDPFAGFFNNTPATNTTEAEGPDHHYPNPRQHEADGNLEEMQLDVPLTPVFLGTVAPDANTANPLNEDPMRWDPFADIVSLWERESTPQLFIPEGPLANLEHTDSTRPTPWKHTPLNKRPEWLAEDADDESEHEQPWQPIQLRRGHPIPDSAMMRIRRRWNYPDWTYANCFDVHKDSPELIRLRDDIRKYIRRKLKLKKYTYLRTADPADVSAYTRFPCGDVQPSLKHFRYDFNGTAQSAWNKCLTMLIAKRMAKKISQSCKDINVLALQISHHFGHLRNLYRIQQAEPSPSSNVRMREKKKEKAVENRRRARRHRRKQILDSYGLDTFSKIMENMPPEACSGDEMVGDPDNGGYLSIVKPEWRSKDPAITNWLRTMDNLHMASKYILDEPGPGRFPLPRVESDKTEPGKPPPDLPLPFYDEVFLNANPDLIPSLRIKHGHFDPTFPPEVQLRADRHKHIRSQTDKPLPATDPSLKHLRDLIRHFLDIEAGVDNSEEDDSDEGDEGGFIDRSRGNSEDERTQPPLPKSLHVDFASEREDAVARAQEIVSQHQNAPSHAPIASQSARARSTPEDSYDTLDRRLVQEIELGIEDFDMWRVGVKVRFDPHKSIMDLTS
ncbi:hypothetical protein ONZ45_g7360 [Pleurotus djamor]|nr:hypothetical protein ONZ45_g7360 [Pleurotus djamor]